MRCILECHGERERERERGGDGEGGACIRATTLYPSLLFHFVYILYRSQLRRCYEVPFCMQIDNSIFKSSLIYSYLGLRSLFDTTPKTKTRQEFSSVNLTRPHDHKLRKILNLKSDSEYLKFYWTHWFNNLLMWAKCTPKQIFKISVHWRNYCKSYTSLKFWLKNILSL